MCLAVSAAVKRLRCEHIHNIYYLPYRCRGFTPQNQFRSQLASKICATDLFVVSQYTWLSTAHFSLTEADLLTKYVSFSFSESVYTSLGNSFIQKSNLIMQCDITKRTPAFESRTYFDGQGRSREVNLSCEVQFTNFKRKWL